MLPKGYDPANYGGKIWWNEDNSEMREIWGTQEDYDKHIESGGNWSDYEEKVKAKQKSWDSMTYEEKKAYYREMKLKVSQDGKSHQSIMTKDGVYIDGKKHLPKRFK